MAMVPTGTIATETAPEDATTAAAIGTVRAIKDNIATMKGVMTAAVNGIINVSAAIIIMMNVTKGKTGWMVSLDDHPFSRYIHGRP